MFYYAVAVGRKTGIYTNWNDCLEQVDKFSNAVYKKFKTKEEANNFLKNYKTTNTQNTKYNYKDNNIFIFVDGSFNDKTQIAGYGYVIVHNNKVIFKRAGKTKEFSDMKNVAGELKSVLSCLNYVKNKITLEPYNHIKYIHIVYDYTGISNFVNGSFTTKKYGSEKYKNNFIKYKDFYEKQGIKIKFIKVKGHSGDTFNDLADTLAKQEIF